MYKSPLKGSMIVVAVVLLSACSSTPKPNTEIALSNSALQNAELAGAKDLAPIELRTAQEKQALADSAMGRESYTTAKQLSEQAAVDAELAKVKSEAEKSRLSVKEVEDSINLIKTELGRAKGESL